jgi:DNA-directed RNA polymerase specialized sigma24 family protein
MTSSEPTPRWWDRSIDESGRLLRTDVRESAHKVWGIVFAKARRVLGDASDAPELLEQAVRSVSHYLDRKSIPLHAADSCGLLVLAFCRYLRRLARRRGRVEPVGGSNELAEILSSPDRSGEVDQRLFLEQLTRELSRKARGTLRLRLDGYEWKEIALMLGTTTTAVRAAFWRDVRKAQIRLLGNAQGRRVG